MVDWQRHQDPASSLRHFCGTERIRIWGRIDDRQLRNIVGKLVDGTVLREANEAAHHGSYHKRDYRRADITVETRRMNIGFLRASVLDRRTPQQNIDKIAGAKFSLALID